GLPFDEHAPAGPEELDEVFGLLTLAQERDAELDQHGRPLPPAVPPGPRVAELAGGLSRRMRNERRGYPCGEQFLIALTHDVDLLGAGGFITSLRRLARGRVREGFAFLLDAVSRRDPAFPQLGPPSTCFFLARQEAPQDAYPERYRPALPAALERAGAEGREVGLHASYRAREQAGAVSNEATMLTELQPSNSLL